MIVGLSGAAGCGKSTAADYLVHAYGYTRRRFAGPLKEMVRALGLTDDHIEGSLKEKPCAALSGRTPRFAMQTLGTEWGRAVMGEDFWVNAWRANLPATPFIVAEDVRFPNEADMIESVGGYVVHIDGRGGIAGDHASEGFIPPNAIHVANTGSIEQFYRTLDGLAHPWTRLAA